jgi:predicted GNAT family N-acyltransferase
MEYKVIKKLNKKQVKDLHKLYKNEWWTKDRSKKEIKKMLKHTDIVIGVVNKKGKLIAFARVLSDFVFKAEIYDVIVDKKYRGLGLGELLLTKIIKHKKLKEIKQFNLQCLDELEPFYKKFGFKRVDNLVYMRRG